MEFWEVWVVEGERDDVSLSKPVIGEAEFRDSAGIGSVEGNEDFVHGQTYAQTNRKKLTINRLSLPPVGPKNLDIP